MEERFHWEIMNSTRSWQSSWTWGIILPWLCIIAVVVLYCTYTWVPSCWVDEKPVCLSPHRFSISMLHPLRHPQCDLCACFLCITSAQAGLLRVPCPLKNTCPNWSELYTPNVLAECACNWVQDIVGTRHASLTARTDALPASFVLVSSQLVREFVLPTAYLFHPLPHLE